MAEVLLHSFQHLFGAFHPRLGHGRCQAEGVIPCEADGQEHSRLPVPSLERSGVGTLADLDRDRQLAGPPRRLRQQLELVGSEALLSVRHRQEVERRAPLVAAKRSPRGANRRALGRIGCIGCIWRVGQRVALLRLSGDHLDGTAASKA